MAGSMPNVGVPRHRQLAWSLLNCPPHGWHDPLVACARRLRIAASQTQPGTHGMTGLPPGWARVRLDEIAEVRLGRQRSPKNHAGSQMRPYLRAANVGWDGLKLDDVKRMNFTDEEADVYRLRLGDIVLSEASGSPGEVGKPALWNGEIEDCCFQNTLVRVRHYGVEPQFLLYLLRAEAARGAFVEYSRGVGIHHIGVARLASWPIRLPPLAEQRRIVEDLEEAESGLRRLRREIETVLRSTESLGKSLVATAFAGRFVRQDPNDEPASVLLDRIREERAAQPARRRGRRSAGAGEQGVLL
jgi:hypothetical protein